jgi:hypothetical protein
MGRRRHRAARGRGAVTGGALRQSGIRPRAGVLADYSDTSAVKVSQDDICPLS